MKKQTVIKILKNIPSFLKKRSPEILTGIGIAGMIATTITAVKATPKALKLVDEREAKENKRLTKSEVVKTAWKCYIPAAVTGACSIACLVGASSVNAQRNAALAAAYTFSETAFKEYKEKAVEVVGEKKEQTIRDAIAQDKITKDPVENKEIVITDAGETLCYDVLSGRYFMSDREKINRAVNEINRNMLTEMYVSLNDFYFQIGLPEIKLGEYLGWNVEKGYMDVQFGSHIATNGKPCLVIAYSVAPQYGYDVLTLH